MLLGSSSIIDIQRCVCIYVCARVHVSMYIYIYTVGIMIPSLLIWLLLLHVVLVAFVNKQGTRSSFRIQYGKLLEVGARLDNANAAGRFDEHDLP